MWNLAYVAAAISVVPLSLVSAGATHADPDPLTGYTGVHGGEVCALMRAEPDFAGVRRAVDHILATSELPADQTGRLLAGSVGQYCPEDAQLVEKFIWYVRHHQQQGSGIGVVLGS